MTPEQKESQIEMTRVQYVNLRLSILDQVIREAQEDGDERWKNLLPQVESLNEQRAQALEEERQQQGIPEPEPLLIQAKIGHTKVKGLKPHG